MPSPEFAPFDPPGLDGFDPPGLVSDPEAGEGDVSGVGRLFGKRGCWDDEGPVIPAQQK